MASLVDYAYLTVEGLGDFTLVGGDGAFKTATIDLGHAEPREVSHSRAGIDGEDDDTQFHDGRVVSFEGAAWTPATNAVDVVDRLSAYTRPGLRPWLVYRPAGKGERRVKLRATSLSRPMAGREPGIIRVAAQWRAPDGVSESTEEHVEAANPAEDVDGRAYPLLFDRSYPASTGPGRIDIVHTGSTVAYPVLRIFGPCTDPLVENETSGRQLAFEITIANGDYLEVDTRQRTIRLNGLTASSRYDALDFPASQWWGLLPGSNRVRFAPAAFSAPSLLEVRYRAAWL